MICWGKQAYIDNNRNSHSICTLPMTYTSNPTIIIGFFGTSDMDLSGCLRSDLITLTNFHFKIAGGFGNNKGMTYISIGKF